VTARRPKAILIAGPTASGKSAAAAILATSLRGTVINADSMQVYRELAILTARPPEADLSRTPHRLYGIVPAGEVYSVGRWLEDAARAINEAEGEGRVPILVGGTGLYFKALTDGLAEVPPIPREIGTAIREEARGEGAAVMHARLAAVDPEDAASIRPSDTARIVRALEVREATGRTLAEWQRAPNSPPVVDGGASARIVLAPDPASLHQRISARAEAMAANGALPEVAALLALDLDPELPVMKAIGVRELAGHLRGDTSLDEAVAAVKTETRRYARRQMTWFRGQMRDWRWVKDAAALDLAELTA
jgi:tRNA dimethylallyltransferase